MTIQQAFTSSVYSEFTLGLQPYSMFKFSLFYVFAREHSNSAEQHIFQILAEVVANFCAVLDLAFVYSCPLIHQSYSYRSAEYRRINSLRLVCVHGGPRNDDCWHYDVGDAR